MEPGLSSLRQGGERPSGHLASKICEIHTRFSSAVGRRFEQLVGKPADVRAITGDGQMYLVMTGRGIELVELPYSLAAPQGARN